MPDDLSPQILHGITSIWAASRETGHNMGVRRQHPATQTRQHTELKTEDKVEQIARERA